MHTISRQEKEVLPEGLRYASPSGARSVNQSMTMVLSSREMEVLNLIAYEFTAKEIASKLFISTHTVVSHRKNLKEKLEVKNTAGMIRVAFEKGIFQLTNN